MKNPQSSTKSESARLLDHSRDLLLQQLGKMLQDYFICIDDKLHRQSEVQLIQSTQHDYFDSMCQIRRERQFLQDTFTGKVSAAINNFIEKPNKARFELDKIGAESYQSDKAMDLNLEVDLQQLILRVHTKTTGLAVVKDLNLTTNPFAPFLLINIYQEALDDLELSQPVSTLMSEQFVIALKAIIPTIYSDLDQLIQLV